MSRLGTNLPIGNVRSKGRYREEKRTKYAKRRETGKE
jgi:hypothetical protein